MSTHTPGPWSWDYIESASKDLWVYNAEEWIAAIVAEPSMEHVLVGCPRANARLIAAAPELLEALQDLLAKVEQYYMHASECDAARAAIAKATGEAT
jgi:hypothetical protein